MPRSVSFSAPSFATWNSSSGSDNLPPFANKAEACSVSEAINVRFTKDGFIKHRLGYEEEADLATNAKVDDIITLPTLGGVMFTKSGTKIFQSLDGVTWYTTGLTRTATAREFLFPHEKDVYATNGTDAYTRIAVGIITAVNSGAGTVSVSDGGNFSTGTLYIRGIEVTNATLATNDFTGCTGLTTAMAIGDVVTQTSSPSGAPTGTCIAEIEGSAIVGDGASLFVSNPSTDAEPELFYDFSLSTGGTAKRMKSDVTAVVSGLGAVLIGTKQGMDIATGFQFESGALLTSSLSLVHSIPNARCICEGEREFYALTDAGRILPIMNLDTGFQVVDDQNNPRNNLDFPVQKFIQDNKDSDNSYNFIHYDPAKRELVATILLKTGLTVEIVYQRDIGAWSRDTTKPFSCKTNFKGRVYCGDDSTDKIYLNDEGVTDNLIPILSRFVTGKFRLGRRGVTADYTLLTSGGMLNAVGEFYQRIYRNGELLIDELITADDLVDNGNMSITTGIPIGSGNVGAEVIDGSGSTSSTYRFLLPYEVLFDAEEVQLEWEVQDEGTEFALNFFELLGETENSLIVPHS